MLKRYQVLIPDWLEKHLQYLCSMFDLSFSEIIRGQICFSTLNAILNLHPEYKPDIEPEEIMQMFKSQDKNKLDRSEMHRILSKIYFETRKATEYWQSKQSEN